LVLLREVLTMKMPRISPFVLPVFLLLAGCGQFNTPALDVQTFKLDHRSGYEAAELIAPYVFGDREENPGDMSATDDAITVRETRDNLEKIARVLAEFDLPQPTARLRFQLIEADSFTDEDPAIAEVVGELRQLFRFDGYRLIGETVVSVGGMEGSFVQPFFGIGEDLTEEYTVRGTAVYRGRGPVRLEDIMLYSEQAYFLETSVTAAPGQTLVMGGSVDRAGGKNLILTVYVELNDG
jgi:hypothetical protein